MTEKTNFEPDQHPYDYTKKPVRITALRITARTPRTVIDEFTDHLFRRDDRNGDDSGPHLFIYDRLHATWVSFEYGDYIIKGLQGEFYPCKDDVFQESYRRAPDALVHAPGVRGMTQVAAKVEAALDSRYGL